jgi:hypothetical protein
MKILLLILSAFATIFTALGCSDDGVYTPVDPPDAGQDAPIQACAEKDGCVDAGED